MYTRGRYILFLDADGATHYEEIGPTLDAVTAVTKDSAKGLGCVVGSRNLGGEV